MRDSKLQKKDNVQIQKFHTRELGRKKITKSLTIVKAAIWYTVLFCTPNCSTTRILSPQQLSCKIAVYICTLTLTRFLLVKFYWGPHMQSYVYWLSCVCPQNDGYKPQSVVFWQGHTLLGSFQFIASLAFYAWVRSPHSIQLLSDLSFGFNLFFIAIKSVSSKLG